MTIPCKPCAALPVLTIRKHETGNCKHVEIQRFGSQTPKIQRRFDEYITVLKAAAANSTYVTLNFLADNSVDKEVARSISSDIYLIAISVVIFIVLAVTFLSR